jgi:hypothetical protein
LASAAALLEHGRGDPLLAALEHVEPRRGRARVDLGVAHEADDVAVLVVDPGEELLALEQVGEALGVQHHADQVRAVRRIELDQPVGQGAAGDGQPRAQAHQPRALGAQGRLGGDELGALAVEVGLQPRLAGAQSRDPALEPADPARVRRDLRGQDALGALLATDLAAGRLDLLLDGRERRGRRADG